MKTKAVLDYEDTTDLLRNRVGYDDSKDDYRQRGHGGGQLSK